MTSHTDTIPTPRASDSAAGSDAATERRPS